jgi:Tol biopolymer transport system component
MNRLALLTLTLVLLQVGLGAEATHHRVCQGPPGTILGGPSPDGRHLSCVDPQTGDLALLDLATGERRRLTHKGPRDDGEFAYFSVISPDGGRVACAWFNAEKFYDLRIVGVDGSTKSAPRVLFRNEEAGFIQPSAWSPDGSSILTLIFRKDNISQIALISTADGSARVLRSLNWVYPKKMAFSPDGRFIVYDSFGRGGGPERDIFLLAVDGSREIPLVEHPADDLFPIYSPDGRRVLFASDRSGTMDLWAIELDGATARGSAVLVRRDLGRFLPMGMTRDGGLFYGLRRGALDVYLGTFDAAAGRVIGAPAPASRRLPEGNTAPEWSADGRSLLYLSRRGAENFGNESRIVTIHSVETDEERDLFPRLAHLERVRWLADGRSLLAAGSDRRSRAGLFRIDVATGEVTPVVLDESATFRGLEAVGSSDGKAVLYAIGPEIRIRTLDGGDERRLYRGASRDRIQHLALSPDGKWLAFVSGVAAGQERLLAIPSRGGEARELRIVSGGAASGLEWTAGGRELILTAAGRENPEASLVDFETGAARKLELPAHWHGGLRLHPDGRRIAFTAGESRSEVWLLRDFLR